MSEYVKLTTASELPPAGEAREFEINGKTICVANTDGSFAAMDNVCLHRGGPLGQGMVDGNKIICPWHGWMFDVTTGACTHDASIRVHIFPLKMDGEEVFISLD